MRTHVRFRSPLFRRKKPDEEQVNPGVYGEELASWIHEHIGTFGRPAADHFGEDWGWMVVFGRDYPAWIGCGNVAGEEEEWHCFCEARVAMMDRLLGRPGPQEARDTTVRALAALLATLDEISDVEWFSVDKRGHEHDHAPVLE